jgi:hypothetical protein
MKIVTVELEQPCCPSGKPWFAGLANAQRRILLVARKNGPETHFKINDQKRCEDIEFWDEASSIPNPLGRVVSLIDPATRRGRVARESNGRFTTMWLVVAVGRASRA